MLSHLSATILEPPTASSVQQLRVPAFACLPVQRHSVRAPFLGSVAFHTLLALIVPALLRSLPPDPDRVFQARLRPALQSALILRLPERIYLPVQSAALSDAHSTGRSQSQAQSQAPFQTILIQPGKPVAYDQRTHHLPSLLYLSKSRTPVPHETVVPGTLAPPPIIETFVANSPASALPPPASSPSTRVAENPPRAGALLSLPLPSAWSLVSHGAASGDEVSVLSIAASVPRAKQLVEIPAVNQPGVTVGAQQSGTLSELRGEGNSTVPTAVQDKPLRAKAQYDGKPLELQRHLVAPSQLHMLKTSWGMVEVRDLPSGGQQLKFPIRGSFDVVIVESSPGSTIPDAERLLTGRPVQTVFLTLGTGQDWILQYCLPGGESDLGQTGMVVALGRQPKLEPPFIQQALIPSNRFVRATRSAVFQAVLGVNGRFARLRSVTAAAYQPLPELLPYLEQWQFRPARVDGVAAEVEILLLVPPYPDQ